MAAPTNGIVLPDFIQYLFSSTPKFDCYFVWDHEKPERIGAVKLMLMAHSEVFRRQLEESELKEKDVPIKDIHPETFRGMLKYIYGQDTTPEMSFDEADNLLYVAEKYLMKTLKDKLATRLMELLNTDNICSLLNNPACYRHLQLDSAITDILRCETDRVLASSQFLFMNAEGFLKILEQDGLAVDEIDLWRAAIKWAKHRANSDDGDVLRQQICGFTSHLRLCCLADELCEVIPSGVLSSDEINTICLYKTKEENPEFEEFSNITEPRKKCCSKSIRNIGFSHDYSDSSSKTYSFDILTKKNGIELLPLSCKSKSSPDMQPENWSYEVHCTTTISKIANPHVSGSSSTNDSPTTLSYSTDVKFGVEFEIPLTLDGKNIILQPDTKYSVKITIDGYHNRHTSNTDYINDYFALNFTDVHYRRMYGVRDDEYYSFFPSAQLQYRVTF